MTANAPRGLPSLPRGRLRCHKSRLPGTKASVVTPARRSYIIGTVLLLLLLSLSSPLLSPILHPFAKPPPHTQASSYVWGGSGRNLTENVLFFANTLRIIFWERRAGWRELVGVKTYTERFPRSRTSNYLDKGTYLLPPTATFQLSRASSVFARHFQPISSTYYHPRPWQQSTAASSKMDTWASLYFGWHAQNANPIWIWTGQIISNDSYSSSFAFYPEYITLRCSHYSHVLTIFPFFLFSPRIPSPRAYSRRLLCAFEAQAVTHGHPAWASCFHNPSLAFQTLSLQELTVLPLLPLSWSLF